MANNIKIEALGDAMQDLLSDYISDMDDVVEKEIDSAAKKMLKMVKENSPSTDGERTGSYRKGWQIVKETKHLQRKRIIWNKKHYNRVHLLENGHASKNGGRVRAFPHLEPAYKKFGEPLPDTIAKRIKEGK